MARMSEQEGRRQALSENEDRFRTALAAMPDPVAIHSAIRDETGRIVDFRTEYVNEATATFNGLSVEQQTGGRLLELFPALRESRLFDALVRVVETGEPYTGQSVVYEDPHAAGGPITAVLDTQAVKFRDGYLVSSRDLTARAQVEAALRASEEHHRTLVEESADAIFVLDAAGQVAEANSAAEQLLGCSKGGLLGRPWDELIMPDDLTAHPLHYAELRKGQPLRFEHQLWHADGAAIAVDLSAKMLPDGRFLEIARDIRERKRAEAALQASEARYRALVEQSGDGILISEGSGRYVDANPALCRMLGYSRDELLGMRAGDLTAADDPVGNEGMDQRLAEAKGEAGVLVERRYRKRDGTSLPVEVRFKVLPDGRQQRNVRDISARVRTEQELRRTTELLEATQTVARVGGWELDVLHDTLFWTAETYRIHDTSPAKYTPTVASAIGFYAPESLPIITAAVQDAIERGTPFDLDLNLISATGRRISVRATCAVTVEQGRTTKITGAFQDISERRRLETERERLLAAMDQSTDAVLVLDADSRIRYANQAFLAMSGYARAELDGEMPNLFAGLSAAEPDIGWRTIAAGQRWSGTLVAHAKDGHPFEAEWVMTTTRDASGELTGHVAVARDRSKERGLEDQLRQAQKMEAVGQLAGGIAHDFNNLLTAMRGYVELVRRNLPSDDEQNRADIDQVMWAADRAAALTRQLLAFSRRQLLQPKVLDPAEIVKSIVPMLRRLLGEHITLTAHLARALGRVQVDPTQLEQILVNLAVNARDAMPDGGQLTVELNNVELDETNRAAHAEVAPGPYVLLAVSDTGTGMDDGTKAHVFEPFFTTKEVGKGTGMGLATVYGIVKQSGGFIYVYSEPGHGATFRIYFPRVTDESTVVVVETPAAQSSAAGRETILLVEDEPAVRGFARRALEDFGYTVLEAAGGADALALAAAHADTIALLLTDVVMPGLQGHQLAEQLTAARPELRVLYVSGFTENSAIYHGVPEHGVAFLAKPFSADALGSAVRTVLDGQAG